MNGEFPSSAQVAPAWVQERYERAMEGQGFTLFIPLTKAWEGEDGKWWVEGIATSERVDLQDETVDTSQIQKSLDYLVRFGKFVYEHPTEAELTKSTKRHPDDWLGQLTEARVLPDGKVFVKGFLFKGHELASKLHNVLKQGGSLGLSVEGKRIATIPFFHKGFGRWLNRVYPILTNIAITDKPVNPDGWLALAKAISATEADMTQRLTLQDSIAGLPGGADVLKGIVGGLNQIAGNDMDEEEAVALFKGLAEMQDGISKVVAMFDPDVPVQLGVPQLLKSMPEAPPQSAEPTFDPGYANKKPEPVQEEPDPMSDPTKPAEPGGALTKSMVEAMAGAMTDVVFAEDGPIMKAISGLTSTVEVLEGRLKTLEGAPRPAASALAKSAEGARPVQHSQPTGMQIQATPFQQENETLFKAIKDGILEPEAAAALVINRAGMRGSTPDLMNSFVARAGYKVTFTQS